MSKFKASIRHKYTTIAGKEGTVPNTPSPDDGDWLDTDLYDGQILFNKADKKAFIRLGNEIQSWSTGPVSSSASIDTYVVEIVDNRILLPGAENMTLANIRRYYSAHINGIEVLTSEQTELENQSTGLINLSTDVYDGETAYIKKYGTP